jgi:hypothetical protein
MRAGLAAMEIGEYETAAHSFDTALNTIEAIYADNDKAKAARSLWIKENIKDFKGEPYERAMAFYYRGLLYMIAGDYQNARASFRGGLLQAGFSYDERFQAQFALLNFLEGWAGRCAEDGLDPDGAFAEAATLNDKLAKPPESHSLLLLGEVGHGPVKVADGKDRELLKFVRGPATPEDAVAFAAVPAGSDPGPTTNPSVAWQTAKAADLFVEASTREGRQMDGVLKGKAVFKDTTATIGAVGIGAGAGLMMSGNQNMQYAGAAMAVAGLISLAISEATKPDADIRMWDNLPGTIWLATADPHDLVPHGGGSPLTPIMQIYSGGTQIGEKAIEIHQAGACALGWARTESALDIPDSAPGAVGKKLTAQISSTR